MDFDRAGAARTKNQGRARARAVQALEAPLTYRQTWRPEEPKRCPGPVNRPDPDSRYEVKLGAKAWRGAISRRGASASARAS